MKGIILFLVIAVGLSANPRELHYKVEQINSNTVEVTLDFTPKKGGETLYVPDSAELLSHKKSGKSLKVENSDHQVKYLVKAKGKWKCSGGYIPRIEKDFFHLEGENLFVRPVGRDSEELKMHIQWDENREIASSFGTGINPQDFTASILDLKRSIFLGGKNLNIEKLEIDSANLYFVSHIKKGDISKDKQTILKIMKEQRKMYGARDFNDYMVAILDDTDRGGGRAFVNACCVYMPAKKTPEDMPWIFSHEHFHTFNGIGTHG
jgi:predicted metalloprotease with PDZ domain